MKTRNLLISTLFIFAICTSLYIYISPNKHKNISQIPIKFTENGGLPIVTATIETSEYNLLIDTGLYYPLSLKHEVMELIENKSYQATKEFIGLKGIISKNDIYRIKNINIEKLKFGDILAIDQDSAYNENSTSYNKKNTSQIIEEESGEIGLGLLHFVNFLFDFPHARMIASNDPKNLIKFGHNIDQFEKTKFEINNGIILEIQSSIGPKKFLLDTGCACSSISSASLSEDALSELKTIPSGTRIYSTADFVVGNYNFGEQSFAVRDPESYFLPENIDGILGMTFLRHHSFYLDWNNNVVYFSKDSLK